ncbi:MAG TPA: hypothetical protein PK095_18250 [Myxococcota bacterium]|nr:hypothetical protein [Myxococcota bacterium]
MTQSSQPRRPQTLEFLKIRDTSRPTTLFWDDPGESCRQLVVYSTSNPFPPQMAGPLLQGKMKQFVDEDRFEPGTHKLVVARPENYYCVVWIDDDDNIHQASGLREPAETKEVLIDVRAHAANQVRTYLRARYLPGVVEFRDQAVHVWVRDVEPNKAALNKMATGEAPPDFVLPPTGDGFIDTLTELEWKKFYVAIAIGQDGIRRPQELEIGGYVRLEDPQYLEKGGKKKLDQVVELVRNQLEVDLQRKSLTLDECKAMLKRADDLAPFHPVITQLKQKARERFKVAF